MSLLASRLIANPPLLETIQARPFQDRLPADYRSVGVDNFQSGLPAPVLRDGAQGLDVLVYARYYLTLNGELQSDYWHTPDDTHTVTLIVVR